MSLPAHPTSADIRAYAVKHDCSLLEARSALRRGWHAEALTSLRARAGDNNLEALHGIIVDLLDYIIARELE